MRFGAVIESGSAGLTRGFPCSLQENWAGGSPASLPRELVVRKASQAGQGVLVEHVCVEVAGAGGPKSPDLIASKPGMYQGLSATFWTILAIVDRCA